MAIVCGASHRVHWDGDCADFCGAEEAGDEFDRVGQRDQDAIPGLAAGIEQGLRHAIYFGFELGVSGCALDSEDGGVLRMLASGARDEFVSDIEDAGRRCGRLRHGAILHYKRLCAGIGIGGFSAG